MMLKDKHMCFAVLVTLFGIFAFVANMLPDTNMWGYWPLFIVAAGLCKMFGRCCNEEGSCGKR